MSDSPLAEAEADSLSELFSRDPLQLSNQDIDKIIEFQRRQRARHLQAEATGRTRAKPKGEQKALDLDEIGL